MNENKTMNKQQAIDLFRKESMLLGAEDGIPEYRAVELFGKDTINHLMELQKKGESKNEDVHLTRSWETRNYTIRYITLVGTLVAISENNVSSFQKSQWQVCKHG